MGATNKDTTRLRDTPQWEEAADALLRSVADAYRRRFEEAEPGPGPEALQALREVLYWERLAYSDTPEPPEPPAIYDPSDYSPSETEEESLLRRSLTALYGPQKGPSLTERFQHAEPENLSQVNEVRVCRRILARRYLLDIHRDAEPALKAELGKEDGETLFSEVLDVLPVSLADGFSESGRSPGSAVSRYVKEDALGPDAEAVLSTEAEPPEELEDEPEDEKPDPHLEAVADRMEALRTMMRATLTDEDWRRLAGVELSLLEKGPKADGSPNLSDAYRRADVDCSESTFRRWWADLQERLSDAA